MKMVPLLNPIKPRANPGGDKIAGRMNHSRGVMWYVSNLPGDGGVDWGYDTDFKRGIPLNVYWQRRFTKMLRDVSGGEPHFYNPPASRATNPLRKRAARKTKTIQRAGLAREAYVKRPSQMTGTKPTKRLVARRAVAKRKGTFPNPGGIGKYEVRSYLLHGKTIVEKDRSHGNTDDLSFAIEAAKAIPGGYVMRLKDRAMLFPEWKSPEWVDQQGKRAANPKKSGVVTFHAFNVITKENGKIQVHDGAQTQDAAARKAQQLAAANGQRHVYVATRAWIKSHTGA